MGIMAVFRMIMATTENFPAGFMMYASGRPRTIKFRGSPPAEMTPLEYKFLKYPVYHGYDVLKDGEEWELSKDGTRIRMSAKTFIHLLWKEDIVEAYSKVDFRGKTVLDVGGYIGDTAVLFHKLGASKVIVYEPVEENMPLLRKNIALNGINAEVIAKGIGRERGTREVPYRNLNFFFGSHITNAEGCRKKTIILEDIGTAILESRADIAKFNCQGCEEALLGLDAATIRTVPVYCIDVHKGALESSILAKFKEAGYEVASSSEPWPNSVTLVMLRK